MNVIIIPRAEEDIRDAAFWYNTEQNGLEQDFLVAISEKLQLPKSEGIVVKTPATALKFAPLFKSLFLNYLFSRRSDVKVKLMNLNILNLMIASLYIKYRRKESHFLSAFWAKMFLAFLATCYIISLIRIIIEYVSLYWQCIFDAYLLLVIFALWGAMVVLLHFSTIKYSVLADVELQTDQYNKGIRIVVLCSVLCIIFTWTVMFSMGPTGVNC